MAENSKTNTGILAKAQKRIARTKTKVLQNLGKAEKTKDEAFNSHTTQIDELQETTLPLNKELNHYLQCLKNLNQASKSLHNSLHTVHEDDWPDKLEVMDHAKTFDLLWSDYIQNIQDSVVAPMYKFLHHFPVFKAKIAKRGRKMVDYDNSRHQLEVLQAAKKRDELKIEKAQEELKEAKRIYEEMNQELMLEMPAFYNSRCHFFGTLYASLFGAEYVFHSEIGKVNASLGDIGQKLANQSEPMTIKVKPPHSSVSSSTPSTPQASVSMKSEFASPSNVNIGEDPMYANQGSLDEKQAEKEKSSAVWHSNGSKEDDNEDDDNDSDSPPPGPPPSGRPPSYSSLEKTDNGHAKEKEAEAEHSDENNYVNEDGHEDKGGGEHGESAIKKSRDSSHYEKPESSVVKVNGSEEGETGKKEEDDDDDNSDDDDKEEEEDNDANVYSDTPSNKPIHTPPPGTLYQVEATHRYAGEDVDELNFDPGEIIYVVSFDNPDEQDDGWLMGIRQSNGIKGVFPENFTKKI